MLTLFACKKEETTVNYTADYVGTIKYERNRSSYGGPIEIVDTLYTNVSIKVFPAEEGTWSLQVYGNAPLLIDNFKINKGTFDVFRTNPATTEIKVKGEFLNDSINVAYQYKVYSADWYMRWTIKGLKKSN